MMNPLTIEVLRGGLVESRHQVHAVIADANGQVVDAWGDLDRLVFPRSSVKPIQALPLIETRAADHFTLSDAEIALACGSHGGTAIHIDRISEWLVRLDMDPSALECGPQRPMDQDAADALARLGKRPTRLHNNCSGEHAGFLTTAKYLGEPLQGYSQVGHPIQNRVTRALVDFTGIEPPTTAFAIDGCGIPAIAFPIRALATAAARLVVPEVQSEQRREAIARIHRSMAAWPDMIGGPGRFDTVAMGCLGDEVILKSGVDGVFLAGSVRLGLGLFLKVEDGSREARDTASANLLRYMGVTDSSQDKALSDFFERPLQNTSGSVVGKIRPESRWSPHSRLDRTDGRET